MTIALAALLVRETRRRGRACIVDLAVLLIAFAALTFAHASNVLIVLASAAAGAVVLRGERPTSENAPE